MVQCDKEVSRIHPIKSGVPQGSILAPTFPNIYTADIPHANNTSLATFVDNTGVISSNLGINIAKKTTSPFIKTATLV